MKRMLILLAVPVALVAGCSAGDATPTAQPTTTAPATDPATAAPAAGAGGAATVTATSVTGTGRCHSQDLTVKTGGGDGAAGSYSVNLVFANKSGRKCTLHGYPGVSWVTGDNGTQVNDAFTRDGGGTTKTITLKPGGVAHSVLIQGQTGNFPTATCKPVKARGYRVYPPDETASIFVSAPQTVCSAKGVDVGTVGSVDTGPGDSA